PTSQLPVPTPLPPAAASSRDLRAESSALLPVRQLLWRIASCNPRGWRSAPQWTCADRQSSFVPQWSLEMRDMNLQTESADLERRLKRLVNSSQYRCREEP